MKNKSLNLYGYSERGMVNTLCTEMVYSPHGVELLRGILGLLNFPFLKPDFTEVASAKFIVEQSYSEFGDLDLLILLDGTCKQAVLIEAKVKTSQASYWRISKEWEKFKDFERRADASSNLFMQLYRKMRLVHHLRGESLNGIGHAPLRIGSNSVVTAAAEELKDYSSEVWYICLIPDGKDNSSKFFSTELQERVEGVPCWNHQRMGFVTWQEIEEHCIKEPSSWTNTLANFRYNKGQIYGLPAIGTGRRRARCNAPMMSD